MLSATRNSGQRNTPSAVAFYWRLIVKDPEKMTLRELILHAEYGSADACVLVLVEIKRRLPEIEAAGELAESVIDDDDAKIAHPARRVVTTTAVQACVAAYRAAREERRGNAKDNSM
jgi:hypothetical protein